MSNKLKLGLGLEALSDRLTPTAAVFSNGVLTVMGDDGGNAINVSAAADGSVHVTERGREVAVTLPPAAGSAPATPATTATLKLVVERAGAGANNTLATDASLGAVPDTLLGNGTGTMTFTPRNNAPSTAVGSPAANAVNVFVSNPGGKDVFLGGKGFNLFDWEPGTGTDTYLGAGRGNTVRVVGNTGGAAETDSLTGDGAGGVVYSRNNLVPFKLFTRGIQNWDVQPSAAAGNSVTVGDLTGTATRQVQVDTRAGAVDAGDQNSPAVRLVVNGGRNTVTEGAGATKLTNVAPPTVADILSSYRAKL